MSDIVEQLKLLADGQDEHSERPGTNVLHEAAKEIEHLRRIVRALGGYIVEERK